MINSFTRNSLLALAIVTGSMIGSVGNADATVISAVGGTYFDGTAHQPYAANPEDSREILANATDGNPGTFYVLGIDGTFTIDVSPAEFGTPVTVIEITFGTVNAQFPESAAIYLDGVLKGELHNDGAGGSTSTASGGAITVATNGTSSTFTIPIDPGVSVFTLIDTTFTNYASVYENNDRASDGFDIGEVAFSTVPEPSSLAVLGLGFLALGVFATWHRRRVTW